jgi:regulator of protease activity HflC (stomatin/prohibitin superfamily)
MLTLKYALLCIALCLFAVSLGILAYDAAIYWSTRRRSRSVPGTVAAPLILRWRECAKIAALGWLPLLMSLSIVVIASGEAGVRVSQFSGTRPGTLYPGTHIVLPLIHHVETYSVRDRVFSGGSQDAEKKGDGSLKVQTKEGLTLGLQIAVRYRLDPRQLDVIHDKLPQPLDMEIVPPVIGSTFRKIIPNYTVREVFSNRREEVRSAASAAITRALASDGILVKEVMLRDIVLPAEYAKGLEGLLLKEQENERLSVELDVKLKMVRTAELEAEADKARETKRAESRAMTTVLEAKAQADAMQYTLPLKEKQIQQTRLEAEARKAATITNAEAMAQAKLIDGRAELERQKLVAQADENRVRLMAGADAERMRAEAQVLKDNPLLIQKIIAEKLSDKVQIMMVPMDGKFFFTNDVLRSSPLLSTGSPQK